MNATLYARRKVVTERSRPGSPDEEVAHWEEQLERAYERARRRGLRHPGLDPDVLRCKSSLRYWRALQELQA